MKDVERATAVVTNPQHFAVALEYRPQTMPAPMVVAKGMDEVALRIKEAARWHSIPIVENPPLAQALYRATEVGEAIPAKLYTAVAEILGVSISHAGESAQIRASCAGRRRACVWSRTARMATEPNALQKQNSTDWVVPVATVTLVFVMIVPVPAFLLDLLLATSITLGVIVLLSSLYILRPGQFSVFPNVVAVPHVVPDLV